ncbi:trehalase family glycosidase [Actinomadura opuntiae]|uniref:trehalase family glycosidase n=1 Tax=Actinomadura sp. OS1-43 TaxID=604315 RepID=UPI00255A8909|nr:trehalase family glycosidase [Actinomadura sp. OS1-43]MDL4818460.1 trehalase family glycosidase [Actinomadura sp. OS1-43]
MNVSAAVHWERLDRAIRGWWDEDVVTAQEASVRADENVLFLPEPYASGGGRVGPAWYRSMFAWDTWFSNLALLVHDRKDLVRAHVVDYLSMVERFGFMPNANQVALRTRSQTPVFPDSVLRYVRATGDDALLHRAYPALVTEYTGYWNDDHHRTACGLARCADLGDPSLDPRLAAEAETGLDWTPIYAGDARRVAPLVINCALVRYAEVLGDLADLLGRPGDARRWRAEAADRSALIRDLCWDEEQGFFFDFDHVADRRMPYWSLCGYWPLWSGTATETQARRAAAALERFQHPHGPAVTDRMLDNPHPELADGDLQWMHPAGWPPLVIIASWGLDRYGLRVAGRSVAQGFVEMMVRHFVATGELYEKYNVVTGGLNLPNERYGTIRLHGWTSAAAVLLGRRVHHDAPIEELLAGIERRFASEND